MARRATGGKLPGMQTRAAPLAAVLLATLALLPGCSGGGSSSRGGDVTRPGGGGAAGGRRDARPARKPRSPITFAECSEHPCMLHPGRGRYHQCLNPVGGRCVHYGPPCAPADACMRDPSTASYRTCEAVRAGECDRFGAACQPADRCMLDPSVGMHRVCDETQAGSCRRFGDPCTPAAATSTRPRE